MHSKSFLIVVFICVCIHAFKVKAESTAEVFQKQNLAAEVAQLVSQAFNMRTAKKDNTVDHGSTMLTGFLRILGFDTKRIGAITVNAIIFIAQTISTSFSHSPSSLVNSDKNLHGSPLEWMYANSAVKNYIKYAKNRNLPTYIIDYLQQDNNTKNTECIQVLICISTPLVWGMQRATNAKAYRVIGKEVLSKYIPSYNEIAEHFDSCELKHPNCKNFILKSNDA